MMEYRSKKIEMKHTKGVKNGRWNLTKRNVTQRKWARVNIDQVECKRWERQISTQ